MWQYLIPAGIKAAGGLLSYATRPKRRATTPPFETTPYGGLLQKRARVGIPAPVRGGLLSKYGRTIGGETQKWKSGITGGLVSRGMYGSVAGLKALGEPERRRTGLLGEYTKELDIKSELEKWGAEEELAKLSTEWGLRRKGEEEQVRLEAKQAISDLVGGFAGAGMMGVTDWLEQMETEKLYDLYRELAGLGKEGTYSGGLVGGGVRRPLYQPATVQPFGTKRSIFQDYQ